MSTEDTALVRTQPEASFSLVERLAARHLALDEREHVAPAWAVRFALLFRFCLLPGALSSDAIGLATVDSAFRVDFTCPLGHPFRALGSLSCKRAPIEAVLAAVAYPYPPRRRPVAACFPVGRCPVPEAFGLVLDIVGGESSLGGEVPVLAVWLPAYWKLRRFGGAPVGRQDLAFLCLPFAFSFSSK